MHRYHTPTLHNEYVGVFFWKSVQFIMIPERSKSLGTFLSASKSYLKSRRLLGFGLMRIILQPELQFCSSKPKSSKLALQSVESSSIHYFPGNINDSLGLTHLKYKINCNRTLWSNSPFKQLKV